MKIFEVVREKVMQEQQFPGNSFKGTFITPVKQKALLPSLI